MSDQQYIYCNLKGGLGNIMFQVAATRAFALDANCLCSFPNLPVQLKVLDDDMFHNPGLKHSKEYMKVFARLDMSPIVDPATLKYEGFPFEYQKRTIAPHSIVDGFFQSEKHFMHHRQRVLQDFDFSFVTNEFLQEKYAYLLDAKLRKTSIHVRRGDYVARPMFHPPQSVAYYQNAMRILKEKTDLWVVFSDDLPWCKENLKGDNIVFVENEKDYIEIKLMSLCDNHIVANSSFSWWGAWMNDKPDKTVIGPINWFGPYIQHDTRHVLPDNWIKL